MSDPSLLTAVAIDGLGRDVVYTASWQPPAWVPALVLAMASIVVFILYRRERQLISRFRCGLLILCRLATVGLVVFMLFGWMRREYQTVLPDLVVLIDNSESMAHEDQLVDVDSREQLLRELRQVGLRNASRINLARLFLLERGESLLKRLASNYNLHLCDLVSSDRSPAAPTPAHAVRALLADGKSSQLGRRVRELLEQQRGRSTVALVVFSDGITTEGELLSEVAEDARRQGVPLYVVQLGDSSPRRDLRISDLVADRTVFPHDLVTVSVNLHSAGLSVSDVTVRLREEGMATPVTQVTVSLDANQSRRVNLSFRPDAEGVFNYVVEVDSQADEQQVANNRLPYKLVVEDARIHVLFVQDYPSYEWRYLTTLLGRTLQRNGSPGQSIEMTTVLHQAESGFVAENTMTLDTLTDEDLNPEKV
ncbi:MAG: VWA domain-containing protein, partial [Pirellulales bacterium]|nr:VWA domain-containing protein [Pirellulales bacterium]